MSDASRTHDVSGLTTAELERPGATSKHLSPWPGPALLPACPSWPTWMQSTPN